MQQLRPGHTCRLGERGKPFSKAAPRIKCRTLAAGRSVRVLASLGPSDQTPASASSSASPHQQQSATPLSTGALGASTSSLAAAVPSLGGGSSGGSSGSGWGGGDGGGSSGPWGSDGPNAATPLFLLAAADDSKQQRQDGSTQQPANPALDMLTEESELDEMAEEAGGYGGQRRGNQRCVEIVIEGWPEVGSLPSQKELKDMLKVQEGFVFDSSDIREDRHNLQINYDEYIANVEVSTEYVDDRSRHMRVRYKFTPYTYEGIESIEVRGSSLIPKETVRQICNDCLPKDPYRVDIGLMDKVRERIEKWYQDRGLPFCYVGYFDGMDEGVLRANVTEAKIHDVTVRYEKPRQGADADEDGAVQTYNQGEVVPAERIIEAAGFKKGEHYHLDDGQDAINNIYACGLLEEINIEPEQDPTDPTKINIRLVVEEVQPKSVEMDLDWSFQLKNGLPAITRQSLIPGGSVEVCHENLFGDSQSLTLSLSSSDWRFPAQDLGFQMSYSEPFYKPHTTRNLQVFNTRKTSPVFTPGAEAEVPPVFVDRFGAKGWTSFTGGDNDKFENALLLQKVTTTDENGQPITKGTKVARGYYADNGPATTVSKTGSDLSLSYQGFVTLDNVQFVNGNQLGRRAQVQVDQGLNFKLPGTSIGFTGGLYNRLQASFTKFMQLPFLPSLTNEDVWLKRRAPNTLVLHAKAGSAFGDLGSYDYFTLGGPHSVRGYAPGELGACRRFMELAAEARFPLKNYGLPGQVYGFVEYGHDMGSSKSLEGNPTEYYRKAGSGLGVGVGVKALGACRFEYARDCNAGTGTFFVHWGERF